MEENRAVCDRPRKRSALIRLALLVPAPTLGVLCAMVWFPNTPQGAWIFGATKLWILVFPVVCVLGIDRNRMSFSAMQRGGMLVGGLLGVVISAAIVGAYWLMGPSLIDAEFLRSRMADIGLDRPHVYLGCAAYWVLVNALLEEYVWRWFVVSQCQVLSGRWGGIVFGALAFTLHHIVAMKVYLDWGAVALCAAGVFVGGAVWSWCYLRYRSVWPGYLSHAIVDVAIFAIGYQIVFSAAG